MKAKYLSLLALSALLVGCGPTTSEPTVSVDPSSDPTTSENNFVAPENISLVGTIGGSDWDQDFDLTSSDEGHTWTISEFQFNVGEEWKIRKNHEWNGDWGFTALDEASAALFENAGGYGNIKVLTSGYYTVSFDYDASVISVTLDQEIKATFAEKVAASVAAYSNVASGSLNYRNSWTEAPEWTSQFVYEYGVDKNGDFVKVTEVGYCTEVFGKDSKGNGYGIMIYEDGELSKSYAEITENTIYGPEVNLCNYEVVVNGVQGFVNFLAANGVAEESIDENGAYHVSTNYVFVNEYSSSYNKLFEISAVVSFDASGAVATLSATIEAYDNIVEDLEFGWVKTEESTLTGTDVLEGSLVSGERAATNPVDIDALYLTSFDIVDADNNVVTNISFNAGSQYELYIGNKLPETANLKIDTIEVTTLDDEEFNMNAYYNSWGGTLNFSCETEGTYTVKVSSTNVERTIVVNVLAARAESISAWFCTKAGNNYDTETDIFAGSTYDIYVGSKIFFVPNIQPSAANQEVTVTVDGTSIKATKVSDWKMSEYADPRVAYEIEGLSVGQSTIHVTATAAPEVTASWNINVNAAPALDELVSKEWVSGSNGRIRAYVKFTPSASDATVGSLSVNNGETVNEYTYAYDATTKEFVCSDATGVVSGEEFVIKFTAKYQLYVKLGKWNEYTLNVMSDTFYIEGYWEAYQILDKDEHSLSNSVFTVEVKEGGKAFSFQWFTMTQNFEYGVNDEAKNIDFTLDSTDTGYKFNFVAPETTDLSNLVITLSSDMKTMSVSFTSATYGNISFNIVR